MIRWVTISNFKSLHKVTADFKPLTIIIGPNASGKSNLLDALESVQRLVRFKGTTIPLPAPREEQREERPTIPVNEILWRRAEPTEVVSWEIACHLLPDQNVPQQKLLWQEESDQNLVYKLSVKNRDEDEIPIISQEQLTADWPPISGQRIYLSRREADVDVERLKDDLSPEIEETDISLTDLALHYYARPPFPSVMAFRDYVLAWQFCKISPDQIRQGRIPRSGKNRRLLKDGSNLANVLHYLREEQPADFEYIQNEMYSILELSQIYTREEEREEEERRYRPGRVYLEAEEERFTGLKPFGPDNLSDGTLGLLALLTVLSINAPAPLICLEEPERSIHPQLLRRLAYYLREAAQHTQLIITTHSAELLDHFDPYEQEYLQVLIAYRDQEGATQFVPIRNVHNVQKWLEDYMLGQIWTMGQIEEMLEIA